MLKHPKTPSASPSPTSGRRAAAEPAPPEYETERWKHQVEAEARHTLKRELHGVGAERPVSG